MDTSATSDDNPVDAVRYRRGNNISRTQYNYKPKQNFQQPASGSKCGNCGDNHPGRSSCKALGKQCFKCARWNHLKSVCRGGQQSSNRPTTSTHFRNTSNQSYRSQGARPRTSRPVYQVEDEYNPADMPDMYDDAEEDFIVEALADQDLTDKKQKKDLYASVWVNDRNLTLKLDTGARCNVLSLKYAQLLKKAQPEIEINKSTKANLTAYGGQKIRVYGTAVIKCRIDGRSEQQPSLFQLVDGDVTPILGCRDVLHLDFITYNEQFVHLIDTGLESQYPDRFDGKLGKLPVKYHMTLHPKYSSSDKTT